PDSAGVQVAVGVDRHAPEPRIPTESEDVHAADLHAGDLNGGAHLKAAHGGKVRVDRIAAASEQVDAAEPDREPAQGEDSDEDEDTHREVEPGAVHGGAAA